MVGRCRRGRAAAEGCGEEENERPFHAPSIEVGSPLGEPEH